MGAPERREITMAWNPYGAVHYRWERVPMLLAIIPTIMIHTCMPVLRQIHSIPFHSRIATNYEDMKKYSQ